MPFKFALGSKVRDTVTGFSGHVVGATCWLGGANIYAIQVASKKKLEGDFAWLHEGRLELVAEGTES